MIGALHITREPRLTLKAYVQGLAQLLTAPGDFFAGPRASSGFGYAFGFLLASSVFHTLASLTQVRNDLASSAGILLVNALGMPLVTAAISYGLARALPGPSPAFKRLFSLYAFASALTLLVSWIPLFLWLTEPWKWILVAMGLVHGCRFKRGQAVVLIGLSIPVVVLLFWSLAYAIVHFKGAM